jgi:hypothetical protein
MIFAEMRQMFRDNKPVDGLTLFDALEGKGLAEQVGGLLTWRRSPRTLPALQTSWHTLHQSGSRNGALRYQPPDRSY